MKPEAAGAMWVRQGLALLLSREAAFFRSLSTFACSIADTFANSVSAAAVFPIRLNICPIRK